MQASLTRSHQGRPPYLYLDSSLLRIADGGNVSRIRTRPHQSKKKVVKASNLTRLITKTYKLAESNTPDNTASRFSRYRLPSPDVAEFFDFVFGENGCE